MKKSETGSIVKVFNVLLVTLVITALTVAVLYLLSDRNHRKFRLFTENGELNIERGKFLPTGFEPYIPKAESMKDVYQPIKLPKKLNYQMDEVFEDRFELDRTIFGIVVTIIRKQFDKNDRESIEQAKAYIDRLQKLPGLNVEQRKELTTLKADYSYSVGFQIINHISDSLNKAKQMFETSIRDGSSYTDKAKEWIKRLEKRITAYETAIEQDNKKDSDTSDQNSDGDSDDSSENDSSAKPSTTEQESKEQQQQENDLQLQNKQQKQQKPKSQKWRL